ncbi:MAG: type II toxin-antitoxin system VapC family toxin [Gammaproteobacteria bacterium]
MEITKRSRTKITEFVIDASIALAWCFKDEASSLTTHLLESLENDVAIVPSLWHLEMANVLVNAERKKRVSYADIMEFVSLLEALPIKVDHETPSKAFHEILSLSYTEGLTSYDAAYLELAMRKGIPLATKDQLLHKAANKIGVKTL